jgi:hypothetical protein
VSGNRRRACLRLQLVPAFALLVRRSGALSGRVPSAVRARIRSRSTSAKDGGVPWGSRSPSCFKDWTSFNLKQNCWPASVRNKRYTK